MRTRTVSLRLLLAALCAAASLAGCSGSGGSAQADYAAAYKNGRYSEAFESASRQATVGSGPRRERASLIAGMSAHALNRNEDAVKFLTPVQNSSDDAIAGEAGATLGLIAAEKMQHEQAAELLVKAGRRLDGDNAARAFMYAGDSYKSLRKDTEARGMWALAQTKVQNDSNLRVLIGDRLRTSTPAATPSQPTTPSQPGAGVRHTVQVGAFSSFTNAQKQLSRYRSYGNARVVEITSRDGRKLFAVRIGQYATRAEAERVRQAVGEGASLTTTAGE
jgi:cell division septation protein DedD